MVTIIVCGVILLISIMFLLASIILSNKGKEEILKHTIEEQDKIIESLKRSKQNFLDVNKALSLKVKELEKELEYKKDPNKKVYRTPFDAVEGYLNGEINEKDIRDQMQ